MYTKILVYVDAENISVSEAEYALKLIRSSIAVGEVLIGKFYGCRGQINSVQALCLNEGYDYVDTTNTTGNKNQTDIKLIVDCMLETLTMDAESISRVYVVSKDSDFTPMIKKLKALNLEVISPLNTERLALTVNDVSKALTDKNWQPRCLGVKLLDNQFSLIKELLDDSFSDELIESFVRRKQLKVLKALTILGDAETIDSLRSISVDTFSFWSLMDAPVLRAHLRDVISVYICKMYGFRMNAAELDECVREAQRVCM